MENNIKEAIKLLESNGYFVAKVPEEKIYVAMQENVWKQDMENVWTVVVSHVFAVVICRIVYGFWNTV